MSYAAKAKAQQSPRRKPNLIKKADPTLSASSSRRSFDSLGTCLGCFADRHDVPLLQRRIFTAKQSSTEGGGSLGSEYE